MISIDECKLLITNYYQSTKANISDNARDDTQALTRSTNFINSIKKIEQSVGLKFPKDYLSFIEAGGLRHFENEGFQIYLYDDKDIIEFNRGDSSYPNLQSYLLFGQDEGSYSYFFDTNNLLGKGKDAVYRIDRGLLSKEYFIFLSKDFISFFHKMIDNEDLSSEYIFKLIHTFTKNQSTYKQIKDKFNMDTIQEIDNFKSLFTKLDGYDLGYNMNDEDFTILDEIETRNRYSITFDYKVFLSEFRGGTYWSKKLLIDFYADDGLSDKNITDNEKNEDKHADFFIFASTDKQQELYFDPKNELGHGPNAVYITSLTSQDLSKGIFFADNLHILFQKLVND